MDLTYVNTPGKLWIICHVGGYMPIVPRSDIGGLGGGGFEVGRARGVGVGGGLKINC